MTRIVEISVSLGETTHRDFSSGGLVNLFCWACSLMGLLVESMVVLG